MKTSATSNIVQDTPFRASSLLAKLDKYPSKLTLISSWYLTSQSSSIFIYAFLPFILILPIMLSLLFLLQGWCIIRSYVAVRFWTSVGAPSVGSLAPSALSLFEASVLFQLSFGLFRSIQVSSACSIRSLSGSWEHPSSKGGKNSNLLIANHHYLGYHMLPSFLLRLHLILRDFLQFSILIYHIFMSNLPNIASFFYLCFQARKNFV